MARKLLESGSCAYMAGKLGGILLALWVDVHSGSNCCEAKGVLRKFFLRRFLHGEEITLVDDKMKLRGQPFEGFVGSS